MPYIRRDLRYPNNTLKAKQNTQVVIVSIRDCMALCDSDTGRMYINVIDLVDMEEETITVAEPVQVTFKRTAPINNQPTLF